MNKKCIEARKSTIWLKNYVRMPVLKTLGLPASSKISVKGDLI